AGGRFLLADFLEMSERGEKAVDTHRRTRGRDALSEEAHHQIVITPAAEDRSELRCVEQHCLEDGAGVVSEAARDGEIERHSIIAVAERVEVSGNPGDNVDFPRRVRNTRKEVAQLG